MPGIVDAQWKTWSYKSLHISTYPKQNVLNTDIQDASLRFFIYLLLSLLFGILIGILMALKVEKRREMKGYVPI